MKLKDELSTARLKIKPLGVCTDPSSLKLEVSVVPADELDHRVDMLFLDAAKSTRFNSHLTQTKPA